MELDVLPSPTDNTQPDLPVAERPESVTVMSSMLKLFWRMRKQYRLAIDLGSKEVKRHTRQVGNMTITAVIWVGRNPQSGMEEVRLRFELTQEKDLAGSGFQREFLCDMLQLFEGITARGDAEGYYYVW